MRTLRIRALISKGDPAHSSRRTAGEVVQLFQRVNEIWRQADIRFDATVTEWTFDQEKLSAIVRAAFERRGDVDVLREVTGDTPRETTAIYLKSIGGSSGKVFRPNKAFMVVDDPKVDVSRTTAHEIGHMFDLEHWLDSPPPSPPDRPPNQLMARTQAGTELIPRDVERVKSRLPTCGLEFFD